MGSNQAGAGSRERILARVARATSGRMKVPHPDSLAAWTAERAPADPTRTDPVAEFVKRFTSQGGEVVEGHGTPPAGEWLKGFLRGLDTEVTGVSVGADVPPELRPQLPVVAAAHAGAGISVAWAAVAETGSLILPSTGTRAVQLLPPVHILWVPKGRVFARMEDALRELQGVLPAAVGLHSAPSKSADIGQTVVTGVHGPGRCIAVLA